MGDHLSVSVVFAPAEGVMPMKGWVTICLCRHVCPCRGGDAHQGVGDHLSVSVMFTPAEGLMPLKGSVAVCLCLSCLPPQRG